MAALAAEMAAEGSGNPLNLTGAVGAAPVVRLFMMNRSLVY